MAMYGPGTLQTTTENGATTNIQSEFKNANSNLAGLICDVTDTGGFAKIQQWQINNANFLYVGTIFGINGFVNELNNSFFFGNANALNFYLINTASGQHQISVNGNLFNFNAGSLDLGAKNLLSTGVFSDGTTPINSGHEHLGTGNSGKIIPHVTVDNGRALDTVYQNTGARPIMVHGSILATLKLFGDTAFVDCLTDGTNPPTTLQARVGTDWRSAAALSDQEDFYHHFLIVVQPSHYWSINSTINGSGNLTLEACLETPI